MSDKEISVSKSELEKSNGNLKMLLSSWNRVTVKQNPAKRSSGHSAELINENCFGAKQTQAEMNTVLSNSIQFFNNLGITFTEADEKSTEDIKGK